MKLGLDEIAGIRNETPSTASLIERWQADISSGWQADHLSDGTHRYVRERSRTTPMGEWITVPFAPSMFHTNAGTWTVGFAAYITVAYMLVGKSITVRFYIESSTITIATPNQVFMDIPGGYRAKTMMFGTFLYDDNGTRGVGMVYTPTQLSGVFALYNNRVIAFATDIRATGSWSLSTALTFAGQLTLEIE